MKWHLIVVYFKWILKHVLLKYDQAHLTFISKFLQSFSFSIHDFFPFPSFRWTSLSTMKKSTLILLLIAVLGAFFIQSVDSSPLFFDFFKNIFGGGGRQNRPSYNNNQNQWANGGRVVKQKRFPWDIFGMFGFKNVIRPNKRPNNNNYRPPNSGRPTTQWPPNNNCGSCGWDISQNSIGQNRPVSTNLPNYGNRQPNYRPPNNPRPTSVAAQPTYGGRRPNGFTTRSPIVSVAAPNPNTRRPTIGSQVPNNNVNNNNAVNVGGGSFSPAQQYFPVNGNGNLPTYFPTLPASDFTTPTPQRQQTQVRRKEICIF